MAVQGVNPDGSLQETSSHYNSTSTKNANANSSMNQDSFLKLLVAQMQYQDPLEPQSNTEYVAQFAQFSQVEAMQNMQSTYQQSLASNLVGKPVIMRALSTAGEDKFITGRVDFIQNKDSKTYLSINGSMYDINDLDSVMDEDYFKQMEEEEKKESK